ncbi:MAG: hypothetical protein ACFFG0_44030, partial [Candidatus Thorarchaeota archaeon]
LKHNYSGPTIYKSYLQRVLKYEKKSKIKLNSLNYKDIPIYLYDLNIDKELVSNKSIEEIKTIIEKKLSQSSRYKIDLKEHIKSIIDLLSLRTIFLIKDKQGSHHLKDKIFKALEQYDKKFLESLLFEITKLIRIGKNEAEIINERYYRFDFIESPNDLVNSTFFSILNNKNNPIFQKMIQEYILNKFNALGRYISPNSLSLGKIGELKEVTSNYEILHDFDTDFALKDLKNGLIVNVEKNNISNKFNLKEGNIIHATIYSKFDLRGMSSLWFFKGIRLYK